RAPPRSAASTASADPGARRERPAWRPASAPARRSAPTASASRAPLARSSATPSRSPPRSADPALALFERRLLVEHRQYIDLGLDLLIEIGERPVGADRRPHLAIEPEVEHRLELLAGHEGIGIEEG